MPLTKGPKRLEIERRLTLFQANRPTVIAREMGVSLSWICEISQKMKEAQCPPLPSTSPIKRSPHVDC